MFRWPLMTALALVLFILIGILGVPTRGADELVAATFLGGADMDEASSVAVDSMGNIYVTGYTTSADFPVSGTSYGSRMNASAFVAKLDPQARSLIYSVVVGGEGSEGGGRIALDTAGNAYVVGSTTSADFPTTLPVLGPGDCVGKTFVLRLNSSGDLDYSFCYGGTGEDRALSVGMGEDGSLYVAGRTTSLDLPVTADAVDATFNGVTDAFFARFDASNNLAYATYLGGSGEDASTSLALGPEGSVFLTGRTESLDFPVTPGAASGFYRGWTDAFVAKLDGAGGLAFSTFVGGVGEDVAFSIAVDSAGEAWIAGRTSSPNLAPTGAYDRILNGSFDVFVAKLHPTGEGFRYLTYIGGQESDWAFALATDARGFAYVTGFTESDDFPTTPGSLDSTYNGPAGLWSGDGFITVLAPDGDSVHSSAYLGGAGFDRGSAVSVDSAGTVYVAGGTSSSDFPVTSGAFDASLGGEFDSFVVRMKSPMPDNGIASLAWLWWAVPAIVLISGAVIADLWTKYRGRRRA